MNSRIPLPPPETGLILDNGMLRAMTNEERAAANLDCLLPEMDALNREIHNLLTSLGFLMVSRNMASKRYIYQRKTPQTNIIAEIASKFNVVTVAHGSAMIDNVYEIIERDDALAKLEYSIHRVSLQQIDESSAQMPQK